MTPNMVINLGQPYGSIPLSCFPNPMLMQEIVVTSYHCCQLGLYDIIYIIVFRGCRPQALAYNVITYKMPSGNRKVPHCLSHVCNDRNTAQLWWHSCRLQHWEPSRDSSHCLDSLSQLFHYLPLEWTFMTMWRLVVGWVNVLYSVIELIVSEDTGTQQSTLDGWLETAILGGV